MIILLFDAHKLDISDEFKRCIQTLKGNDTKIKIVLNNKTKFFICIMFLISKFFLYNIN